MSITLPQSAQKVLEDTAFGHVLTYNADGSPQLTMVWMDLVNGEASFNTAEGRRKVANLRRDPRIVVSVQDRNDPQAYMLLTGTATLTPDGADAQVDKLAKRFIGRDTYPFRRPAEQRLMVRIATEKIGGTGPRAKPWA